MSAQKGKDFKFSKKRKEKADLVCLQETHLHKSETKLLEYIFPGERDHPSSMGQSGGVMIVYQNHSHLLWIIRK